ncbi:hypothetical protein ON010_g13811 [Phytophthora cinnamomi]|nr:hypothetical protein ON010_g13811 [Phytophthora cinnamomi]
MKKKAKPQPSATSRPNGRTARRASSRKSAVQLSEEEEEEDDDAADEDNDGDSDFVGESVSEEEEEDDDDSVSEEEGNARPPARRRPVVTKSRAKPKSAGNRRGKQRAAPSPAVVDPDVAANASAHASDVDSLDIEFVGESEDSEGEEDVYEGPRYFIEYAINGRAKVGPVLPLTVAFMLWFNAFVPAVECSAKAASRSSWSNSFASASASATRSSATPPTTK